MQLELARQSKKKKKQELIDYASNLEKENQKYKEVINKVIEYIKQHSNNLSEYLYLYE